jgi:hypothetical protein
LSNRTFLFILFSTLFAQVLIVQFGYVVFELSQGGLSIANWGLSILLGSGSLLVGVLVRLLPTAIVPRWILKNKKVATISPAIIVEVPSTAKPEGPPPAVRMTESIDLSAAEELKVRQTEHVVAYTARRNSKRDPSNLQLIDPRLIKEAHIAYAKQHSSNH